MGEQVVYANGAFGYTDLDTKVWSNKQPFKSGESNTTIARGQVVALNTEGNVIVAVTDGNEEVVVGIAAESIPAGEVGLVTVQGLAENALAQGSISAANLLMRSATTAGYVAAATTTATATVGNVLGVAVNASAGGTVDVWVFKA
jgi:hypothetical protein